jgi:hypothetical protein
MVSSSKIRAYQVEDETAFVQTKLMMEEKEGQLAGVSGFLSNNTPMPLS